MQNPGNDVAVDTVAPQLPQDTAKGDQQHRARCPIDEAREIVRDFPVPPVLRLPGHPLDHLDRQGAVAIARSGMNARAGLDHNRKDVIGANRILHLARPIPHDSVAGNERARRHHNPALGEWLQRQ